MIEKFLTLIFILFFIFFFFLHLIWNKGVDTTCIMADRARDWMGAHVKLFFASILVQLKYSVLNVVSIEMQLKYQHDDEDNNCIG